jgi:two-component system, OmpR family, phosphate regulon sensor histidine kinase PhoR
MLETRFYWKLFAGYVLLILFTAVMVAVASSVVLERAVLGGIITRLQATARLVTVFCVAGDQLRSGPEIQLALGQLDSPDDARITVINAAGIVLADNWEDPRVMENHAARPEVNAARTTGEGYSRRFSGTIEDDLMYYALRVDAHGTTLGFVRTSLRLDEITSNFQHLRYSIAGATLIGALIALVLGLVVSRQITAPLSQITLEIEHLAHGDTINTIHTNARDEVGALARSFNKLAGVIQQQLKDLDQDRMQLQAILGGMVEGVLAVDEDECILHLNRAAGRVLNLNPQQCIGKRTWEMVRIPPLVEKIKEVLESGCDEEAELNLMLGDTERRLHLAVSPLHDAEGQLTGAVVVIHDMTKLRQLEEIRRDFVANVSHELKTPLTAIRGLVETLIEDPAMDQVTHARFLIRIQLQADRLSKLVTDLLSLSRIESQADEMERRLIDLRQPAQEVFKRMLPQAEAKHIHLACALPQQPAQTWADHESISEAISNLLDNAIKYTPEHGQVELALTADERTITITVADNGIGIDHQHHERLFERFYRVDKARSRELGGTGLGLSIVKHIALSHDGTVSLTSQPGKGSTFRITIPINISA